MNKNNNQTSMISGQGKIISKRNYTSHSNKFVIGYEVVIMKRTRAFIAKHWGISEVSVGRCVELYKANANKFKGVKKSAPVPKVVILNKAKIKAGLEKFRVKFLGDQPPTFKVGFNSAIKALDYLEVNK